MKLLVLFGILLCAYLLWRHERAGERAARRPAPPPPPRQASLPATDMVQCPVCSVHVPRGDAVLDPAGIAYCCPEHRARGVGRP